MTAAPSSRRIAFQGEPGAYSDLACRQVFPRWKTLPCDAFEDAIAAVRRERAALAMLPIENSVAGRVADIHHLLPDSGLHIIGEHYHHIGLYAYRRAALERFVALPPSPLERRESLEQLRALEAGMRIDAALVDTVPFGVDTQADLTRARELMAARTASKPA